MRPTLAPLPLGSSHMGEYFSDPFQIFLWAALGIAVPLIMLAFFWIFFVRMMWENEWAPAVEKEQIKDRLDDFGGYRIDWGYKKIRFRWLHSLPVQPQIELEFKPRPQAERCRSGIVDFDVHFATRQLDEKTHANLVANQRRLLPAAKFLARHGGKFSNIQIERDSVTLKFSSKLGPNVFSRLFKRMLVFARAAHAATGYPPLAHQRPVFSRPARAGVGYRSAGTVHEQEYMVENVWGKASGPLSASKIVDQLHRGRLLPVDRVAPVGADRWQPIGEVDELRAAFASAPAPPQKLTSSRSAAAERKSRLVRRLSRSPITLLIGAGLTAGGAGALAAGRVNADRASESLRWPDVPGKITRSEIVKSSSGSGSNRKTSYNLKLAYAFRVDGRAFQGDRVWFGPIGRKHAEKQAIVNRYPVKKAVRVYYRPSDPTVSVLVPGVDHLEEVWFGFLLLFPGLGALLVIGSFRALSLLERVRVPRSV